ncbi:MAG: enoyl-CoA hydratase/isomerase family protein [Bacteroidota bacterium]
MNNRQLVKWTVQNSIGILTISNKPENYLEKPEFVNLAQLKKWTSDDSLKGLIIHGDGRHFSAGANINNIYHLAGDKNYLKTNLDKGKAVLNYIENLNIPTVAAITGTCFGGGLEIALACHIRVCSKNSLFAAPETNHNLMPGLSGTIRLPKLIGKKESLEMILIGDIINAEKALEIKLVDYVIQSKDVINFSVELITKMTEARPANVISYVIRSINNAKHLNPSDAMKEETKMFCKLALDAVKEDIIS